MKASEQTAPADYLDAIWRAADAHALDWRDANRLQNDTFPKCDPHGRPAPATFNGVKVCELCMLEGRHRR